MIILQYGLSCCLWVVLRKHEFVCLVELLSYRLQKFSWLDSIEFRLLMELKLFCRGVVLWFVRFHVFDVKFAR